MDKLHYRFPPCPMYDVEHMESWLEDLAAGGLFLCGYRRFLGMYVFEPCTPRAVRFRLQPCVMRESIYEDFSPPPAAKDLAEEWGWNYLGNREQFSVYWTDDPGVPELNTDPQIMALAVDQQMKKQIKTYSVSALLLALTVVMVLWSGPISYALSRSNLAFWTENLFLVAVAFLIFYELRSLKQLRDKLKRGEDLDRRKDWRQGRLLRTLIHLAPLLLIVGIYGNCIASIIWDDAGDWAAARWTPLPQYESRLPFASMEDLAGGGSYDTDNWVTDYPCHAAERSTLLAKRQIRLRQQGRVLLDGASVLNGWLELDYYELRFPFLARLLYEELQQKADRDTITTSLPQLPTERELAWNDRYLLLQNGSKVLLVRFSQTIDAPYIPIEEWSVTMADHFLQ